MCSSDLSIAWWSYRVIGPGIWVLLALVTVGMVTLARGFTITHPVVRTLGALLVAIAVSALHEAWLVPLGVFAGPMVGLPSGLLGSELELGLADRFGDDVAIATTRTVEDPDSHDEFRITFVRGEAS